MTKLRRKIKFLKEKLKVDTDKLEAELVVSRKTEYNKLSQRIVMHTRRQKMLEFCQSIKINVENDRKINEETNKIVPDCTEVLQMAFYDTTESDAKKLLEREESLVEKFKNWGL